MSTAKTSKKPASLAPIRPLTSIPTVQTLKAIKLHTTLPQLIAASTLAANLPAQSILLQTIDECDEAIDVKSNLIPSEMYNRKRHRLDHLSPEQKLQRRKLKNRVAAQTARDKKKARMDELEACIAEYETEMQKLKAENELLWKLNSNLQSENQDLKVEMQTRKLASKSAQTRTEDATSKVTVDPAEGTGRLLQHLSNASVADSSNNLGNLSKNPEFQDFKPNWDELLEGFAVIVKPGDVIRDVQKQSKTYMSDAQEVESSETSETEAPVIPIQLPTGYDVSTLDQLISSDIFSTDSPSVDSAYTESDITSPSDCDEHSNYFNFDRSTDVEMENVTSFSDVLSTATEFDDKFPWGSDLTCDLN